ncbi:hypothetical protein CCUS01_00019 [Colletotrichum cuscutae]|uniref:Uncharacterized protein n=1 Tax=Colletotrichum cuscutae TaxID=1209917 RepID=A0AAI9YDM4_9PEZI|nr:hypothetical protein CCUS01_00019 [Colletotrichum cuscutae]
MTLISSVGVRVPFPEFSSRFAKDADVVLKDFGEMFEVGICRCEISGRLTGTEKSDSLFGARWFEAAESNIDQGASRHLAFSFLIKIGNKQYIMDLVASLWRSSYFARYAHRKLEVAGAEVGSSAQHAIAGEYKMGEDILPAAPAILPPSVAAAATRPPVSGTHIS